MDQTFKTTRVVPIDKRQRDTLNSEVVSGFMDMAKDHFDSETLGKVDDFIHQLAEGNDLTLANPLFGERTDFGGDLSSQLFSTMGVTRSTFNPENISYDVMGRMMKDPQIAIGFSLLSEPIRSLNFVVKCKNKKIKILVDHALRKIWTPFIADTMRSMMYGYSAFEKVFKYEHIRILDSNDDGDIKEVFNDVVVVYDKLKNPHPSTISLTLDRKQNYNGFTQQKANGNFTKIPKNKSALFTYNFEFGNYYGKGLLRNVYKYWYWGELLYQFMLRYYESTATPPVIVTAPRGVVRKPNGTVTDNLQVGLDLGRSLLSNSIAVLPYLPDKGITSGSNRNQWSIDRLKDDRRGPMFVETINHINTMKLLGLHVPQNVADQEIGERDAFFFTQEGQIRSIEDFINKQIIPPLIQFNIAQSEQVPCTISLDKMSHTRKMMLKELFIEDVRALRVLQRTGTKTKWVPDLREMANQLEVPMTEYESMFDDSNFNPNNSRQETSADVETDFNNDQKKFEKPTRGEAKKDK